MCLQLGTLFVGEISENDKNTKLKKPLIIKPQTDDHNTTRISQDLEWTNNPKKITYENYDRQVKVNNVMIKDRALNLIHVQVFIQVANLYR